MDLSAEVARALRWSAGGRLIVQILNWAMTLVVIRLLVPEDYGLLAMAVVFVNFLFLLNEMGLRTAIVRLEDPSTALLRDLFGAVLLFNLVLFLITLAGAPFVAGFFQEPRLTPMVQVLSINFLVSGLGLVPDALLIRAMDFRSKALVDVVANLVGGVLTLGLALSGYGVWSLIWSNVVTLTIRMIGYGIASPFRHWPRFRFDGVGESMRFGGAVVVQRLLWWIYSSFDTLLVGRRLGTVVLGSYSVAMHLATLPQQKLSQIVNQVTFPAFARIKHDRKQVADRLSKASYVMSFFTFPFFFGVSAIAPGIVILVLGPTWEAVILPLQLITLAIPLRMLTAPIYEVLNAMDHPGRNLSNMVIGVILLPLSLFVGSFWGLPGVALSWLFSSPLWVCIGTIRAAPITGLTLGRLVHTVAVPFQAALVMHVAVIVVPMVLPTGIDAMLSLAIQIVVGMVTYGAHLFLLDRPGCDRVFRFLRS
ncbi:MAG: lipopolysaccharide biosynthesis protein [Magnetococcales bacterium]|nr:lipopolysaccharide biosynthesis protein [Magnetococcales bacterium]